MQKNYPIVFEETKLCPFSLIFENNNQQNQAQKKNKTFLRPITYVDGSICQYLSKAKKMLLDRQIEAIKTQDEERHVLIETQYLQVNNILEDIHVDFVAILSDNFLIQSQYINHLRKLRNLQNLNNVQQNPEHQEQEQNKILFCFLYENETLPQISAQISSKFTQIGDLQQRIYVILVNDQHKLDQSIAQLNVNPIKLYNLHYSGQILEYQLEQNINIFFIITDIKQEYAELLKWIYLGVFQYFDPKYCLVAPLSYVDQKFQCDQMFKLLEANQNIASVNGCIEFKSDQHLFSVESALAKLLNFTQITNTIHQVQDIITTHNPLFSFYRWNFIKPYIFQCIQAFAQLEIQQNAYSPIFPIYNNYHKQDQLYITLNRYVCTKKADLNSLSEHRTQFMTKTQQNQIINRLSIPNTPQNGQSMLYFLLNLSEYFVEYFSISIYFYVVFINSYQLILKNQYNQAVSAFVPIILIFFSIIITILMLILPFLYSMEQAILKKSINNVYAYRRINEQEFQYVSQAQLDNPQNQKFKKQIKTYWQNYFIGQHEKIKNKRIGLEINEEQDIYINIGQFNGPSVCQLADKYKDFYKFSAILNVGFAIIIILNFIFTYSDLTNIENILRLVIGTGLLLIALSQYQKILYFQVYHIFLQYYTYLQKIKLNPTNYQKYLPKMLRQLVINALCLAIIYIIELNTNYQAYIFLVLIIYFMLTQIFDGVLYLRKWFQDHHKSRNITLPQNEQGEQLQINEDLIQQYQNNIFQTDHILQGQNQNIQWFNQRLE